ncbi:hypothetical protein ABZP36_002255 [Zizania latifolia]
MPSAATSAGARPSSQTSQSYAAFPPTSSPRSSAPARPPPPLALPLFLWADRQKCFRHYFPALHVLASLLSTAGLPAAADQLPDLMRAHVKPVSHSQLNLLVRLHTAARRPLRALHVVRRFRHDFSVQPEVHACNRVLGALAAAGQVGDTVSCLMKCLTVVCSLCR